MRVLPIRLRPDFSVVFEGYAGGAEGDGMTYESLKAERTAADRGDRAAMPDQGVGRAAAGA
jgi:hypothetical protein